MNVFGQLVKFIAFRINWVNVFKAIFPKKLIYSHDKKTFEILTKFQKILELSLNVKLAVENRISRI